ncbi:MAG: hypothetical protein JOZ54_14465 [Acidobacteria bacterium]|nr:hypothetical protein [Acidobacteriota bacterium]
MGLALWLAAGVAAVILARIVPLGRPQNPLPEILFGIVGGFLGGLAATARDFGGWKELDWRAGLFAFFVAAALTGVARLVSVLR